MSLIPNSDELNNILFAALEEVSESEKEEWIRHPVTEAIGTMFEVVRMAALENMEAGAPPEVANKLAAQASLMRDLRANLASTVRGLKEPEEADDAYDPTSGTQDSD